MRRLLTTLTALVAVAAIVLGAVLLDRARSTPTPSPSTVAREYFAALARADAPAALGLGTLPAGSRAYLTGAVLAEQQRLAPLRDVHVGPATIDGDRASVRYSYELDFATGAVPVSGSVELQRSRGRWRLSRTTVLTTLVADRAGNRLTVAGARLPTGPVTLFPGAVPVESDTELLQARPVSLTLGTHPRTVIHVDPSRTAVTSVPALARAEFIGCLRDPAQRRLCPVLSERVLPGSLRGTLNGPLTLRIEPNAAGTFAVTGAATFAGRWQQLDFQNIAQPRTGRLELSVVAHAYPTLPLRVWVGGSS